MDCISLGNTGGMTLVFSEIEGHDAILDRIMSKYLQILIQKRICRHPNTRTSSEYNFFAMVGLDRA